ncbi:MAG: sugar phosphate isomerase/epimerase family protein [Bryobacteraceae bacterium]|jgi:sugar phosphate isomerase/epimerase
MKISFSTLACPSWNLDAVVAAALREGFDGIELRFIESDDRLWQRPEFSGASLRATCQRLKEAGLEIPCLDTSCFFHHPEAARRREAVQMGRAMIELAAELGAPGIRVFGDRVQPGADCASTAAWIAEGVRELADFGEPLRVQVWLESHGDFACARDTVQVLDAAGSANTGVVWDPANAFSEFGEEPRQGLEVLGVRIRHVHIKDARPPRDNAPGKLWDPVLMGEGQFPAQTLVDLLERAGYGGFVSFEWEKRWHPEIPEPEVAVPHFMRWMRAALASTR